MRNFSSQLAQFITTPHENPEDSLQIDQISPTFLKIITGDGSSTSPQKLIEQLKLGQLLKGQVVQIFSEGTKALLNLEGQKIIVQGDPSFKNGQIISARVEQISPAPVLKIISPSESGAPSTKSAGATYATETPVAQEGTIRLSSGKSSPISYFSKHDLDFLKISRGHTYPASIKQVVDPDNVMIKLQNRNFIVHTVSTTSLKPGDQIPVVAEKTAKGMFHFFQSKGAVIQRVDAGMIKPYLPAQQPFGEMISKLSILTQEVFSNAGLLKLDSETMARIKQTLQLLSPGAGKNPDAGLLKNQVDASGINYEARVKQFFEQGVNQRKAGELGLDLKGQLLDMIQKLEDQANQGKGFSATQSQTLKEQAQGFRHAVENIELNQLTNHLAKQENQSLLLQIPNPYGQRNPPIKLYVRSNEDEHSGNGGDGKKTHNLVFFLDLSELGNLRVDSQISPSRLSVKIKVESRPIADFIDSRIGELNTRLSVLGFQADLTCCVEEKIAMDLENELPAILFQDEARLVDVTT